MSHEVQRAQDKLAAIRQILDSVQHPFQAPLAVEQVQRILNGEVKEAPHRVG